jgi:hypothetical protein
MNAPNFPLNPMVGQRWQQWVWNGARWVCSPATGVQVIRQVFKASGTYMPSPGLVTAFVTCLGGGGGGGLCVGAGATFAGSGGGGGSGGLSSVYLPASLVLGGVVVTVGAGGVGGVAPTTAATPGGATSFGGLCIGNGGTQANGLHDGAQGMGDGGAGAPVGVGDVTFPGSAGESGMITGNTSASSFTHSAAGGQIFGGNGRGPNFGAGGILNGWNGAASTGCGGGGGAYNQTTATANGGAGGSGVCFVTEYCWADVVPGQDCGCPPGSGSARMPLGFDEFGP